MQILDRISNRVVLFKASTFPIEQLRYRKNISLIQTAMGIETPNIPGEIANRQAPLIFELVNGEYEGVQIRRLLVEARKLTVEVNGTSEQAETVLEGLIASILKLDENSSIQEVIRTARSDLFFRSDFDFERLLSSEIRDLVTENPEKFGNARGSFSYSAVLALDYDTPQEIAREGISVSRKYLRIERKAGSAPEEAIFFSSAPIESDSHEDLILSLEQRLS